ncbi:MAG: carbohydrate kinase [Bacteroidales bacterium]|nr:carbohydrate kinase [Bacteroidales bacterium]
MKPIVIGIGEFLWDMLPDGKKAGGAPVNFAYHASQNGAEGWAVSAVGDDSLGQELKQTATEHGINMLVETVSHPTGTVKVELKNGQPNFIITDNVAWDYIPMTENALDKARHAAAISFGTLAQRSPVSRETTRSLIAAAPSDALIVYDINLRQHFYSKELIDSSLRMANIFKVNDEELEVLKPMFDIKNESTEQACRFFLREYGLHMLVLTGGDRFSSIYTPDDSSTIDTPKVALVDAVGAGDSFSGALVGNLLSGAPIRDAHKAAVETAAYVCTQSGAWTPAKEK